MIIRQPKSFSSDICNNTNKNTFQPNYIDYVKAHKKIAPFTSRIIARALVEADRRMKRRKRIIKKIEDTRTLCIQRFIALPANVTIRKGYVKCGRDNCEMSHGPYYYAYWKERISISDNQSTTVWKLKKRYIGSYLPQNEKLT
jgi:hypothetical protein